MDARQLSNLKEWFFAYCRSFYSSDPADQKNILTKEEHTRKVMVNSADIASHIGMPLEKRVLAETIALFHDVGRFPQYQRYRTFRDSISTNHAALGASVLIEKNVLKDLRSRDRELILRAVTLHNVFSVPEKLDEESLVQVKLIRDADKLDIWRVFVEFYASHDEDRASAVALGLPDSAEYSMEVIASLHRREMVRLSSLRTLNDFRLLQLAWIFDLNFTRSLQLVLERSVIDSIAASLPKTIEIAGAIDCIRKYVDEKLREG